MHDGCRGDLATLNAMGLASPSGHGPGERWRLCKSMDWPIPANLLDAHKFIDPIRDALRRFAE